MGRFNRSSGAGSDRIDTSVKLLEPLLCKRGGERLLWKVLDDIVHLKRTRRRWGRKLSQPSGMGRR